MDGLIRSQRRAVKAYFGCFIGALVVGLILLVLTLATPLGGTSIIPKLASGFVMLLCTPPLTQVFKRRDRINALSLMRDTANESDPDSADGKRVEDIVWGTLAKMAGG